MKARLVNRLPEPGFRRCIEIHAVEGVMAAGLEDDFHRFTLRLEHNEGVITSLEATTERAPWSTCPDGAAFLVKQFTGMSIEAIAAENPRIHCTHLYELLALCARRTARFERVRFDLSVTDPRDTWSIATLYENAREVLCWELNDSLILSPSQWSGRNLRQLSQWQQELTAQHKEQATLLRRAVHIARGRRQPHHRNVNHATDRGPAQMGACYTYQMPRAESATPIHDWRMDFSISDHELLAGFDPLTLANSQVTAS